LLLDNSDVRVFFSGENVQRFRRRYRNYALPTGKIDLAMGFDYLSDTRYLRFPLWILYSFNPESNYEDIKKRCDELRYPNSSNESRSRFATLVARGDLGGIRESIFRNLSEIAQVDCPSSFMHNDDSLKEEFGDDKIRYIKQYKFNICPENSDTYGYVTEKLFEAIDAGCIPIYWGSKNCPEPEILNQDAILFWKPKGDNADVLAQIQSLNETPGRWREFATQPRLKDDAADIIYGLFEELEKRLRLIIENVNRS
jgi:hypothetical protein